jgi:hypothetical protein
VLHGFGAWAKPGAKRPTQAGVAGGPDFDPDFAEEPGFIEPYLSAICLKLGCPTTPGSNAVVRATAPCSQGLANNRDYWVLGVLPVPAQGSGDITNM